MPRSVDSSVRWRASSWMRWSGLAPISPALTEVKGAPRLEPLVEQVAHEPFAQLDLGRLVEPSLRHVQDQKPAGNNAEDHELVEELRVNPCARAHRRRVGSRR